MTFEEFFKKKKIDLDQLKVVEPVLFAEFQSHYGQMGEKSFDHTKKYWFNNLRRLYHTPEELKVEKVRIENQLAEQTITDTLTEQAEAPPAPKAGFTPRFKAAATKPTENNTPEIKPDDAVVGVVTNNLTTETKAENTSTAAEEATKPKVGFTPRFKAGVTKSAEENTSEVKPEESLAPAEEATKPKVGFTPRFKAGVTKPAEDNIPEAQPEDSPAIAEETPKPKVGFTPRFKAGVTKPKQEDSE